MRYKVQVPVPVLRARKAPEVVVGTVIVPINVQPVLVVIVAVPPLAIILKSIELLVFALEIAASKSTPKGNCRLLPLCNR